MRRPHNSSKLDTFKWARWFHRHGDFSHDYGMAHVQEDRQAYAGIVTVRMHDEILPWLHIGRVPVHGPDMRYIKEAGFGAVLDLCGDNPAEGRLAKLNGIEFLYEHVVDGTCPSLEQFRKLVNWISQQREAGRKVYVHCHAGMGRAPTVVIAFLVMMGVSLSSAIRTVLTRRRRTEVSRAQFVGLAQFDRVVRFNRREGDYKDTEGML